MRNSIRFWNAAVQWHEWTRRRNKPPEVLRKYEQYHWCALMWWAKAEDEEQRSINNEE